MNALRAAYRWTRARLTNRPDTEHSQVLVRIVITSLFSTYLGWGVSGDGGTTALFEVWLILVGELVVSLALFAAILRNPGVSHWRRWVGMVSDYAAIGAVMALQGEVASPLYSIYLWVTIGNGLRFGSRYLHYATVLSVLSFFVMSQVTPYWQSNPYLSWGLLAGAAAVPLYFSSLLKALTRAIEDARRANEAKSRFLANMSHELRTPLNGILAMAELLSASKLQKEQRESADMIHTSAQTLLLLIDEVLDISAIEAGKVRRHEEDFDLNQLLSRVYRMLMPQARAKGLEFTIDTDIRIPNALHGDASHLTQILLNLLQNAVKFTERGSIALHAGELSRTDERIVLKLSVRDTGIGIPEEARQRIFRPFEQVDSGRDRRYGGSGLGTTIAKSLTELMGGRIGVEDNPGGGTHFWVELPFRIAQASSQSEAMGAQVEQTDALPGERRRIDATGKIIDFEDPFLRHRIRVRSMRILVADDQPTNRVVLQRLLEKAGHRILFAEDGEQVLDVLAGETPDLVLLDLHMPGLSGLEVIRQARVMQAGHARKTPIVVLSADATVESMREADRAGARTYLTKPISVPKLLDTIASIAAAEGEIAPVQTGNAGAASADPVLGDAVDKENPILVELAGMGLGDEFIRDFVEQCLRDIGRSMSGLQQAAASADYEAMREAAHAMRGVAENIGATRLVERCRVVMRLDNVQISRQSQNLTSDLDALVEQTACEVRAQLPRLLGSHHSRQDPLPGPDP
ncbi:ATP-binding protein [Lysobacter brunescens]|uniref:Sensory/regulatory protein RpfC n=1 Tax=Lysobacter brunescens TaxID=262323 RepID=A0A514YLQ9_9GAMM|nr:RpfC [Lysobacter brunescens]